MWPAQKMRFLERVPPLLTLSGEHTQTADPADRLLTRTRSEGSPAVDWRPTVGPMPAASRSSAEFAGRSQQEPALLLRVWPRRRCDSPRRVVSRCALRRGHDALTASGRTGFSAIGRARFYQVHLHRHAEAAAYLIQRGLRAEVIEELRIGYAPGRCLRSWLISLGYSLPSLQQTGLVNAAGHDTYNHRIVFPLEGNLYGRSIGAAVPHRFLPGSKGGLYAWGKVRHHAKIILVEGVFDLAVLWQAGVHHATCAFGTHLNALQLRQLCADNQCGGKRRTVYLAFDSDANGSGQRAAQCLSQRLRTEGITTLRVELPAGHHPNSFFVSGGNAQEFRCLLENACP
jgi:hypothetical protein